jgi:hypothetical protein
LVEVLKIGVPLTGSVDGGLTTTGTWPSWASLSSQASTCDAVESLPPAHRSMCRSGTMGTEVAIMVRKPF